MTNLTCTDCNAEVTCFDVATGRAVCAKHVTPGSVYFDVRPLPGGGFGVYRVRGNINLFENDFAKKITALRYGFTRMLEERKIT